jgi:hypothetical protein
MIIPERYRPPPPDRSSGATGVQPRRRILMMSEEGRWPMASRKHVAQGLAAALVIGGAAVIGVVVARDDERVPETPAIVQPADRLEEQAQEAFAARQPRIKQSADTLEHWAAVGTTPMVYGSADAAEHWLAGS